MEPRTQTSDEMKPRNQPSYEQQIKFYLGYSIVHVSNLPELLREEHEARVTAFLAGIDPQDYNQVQGEVAAKQELGLIVDPDLLNKNNSNNDVYVEEIDMDVYSDSKDISEDEDEEESELKAVPVDDDGLFYTDEENTYFDSEEYRNINGSRLLKKLEDKIRELGERPSVEGSRGDFIVHFAWPAHEQLKGLASDELDQKKYKMAMILAITSLEKPTNMEYANRFSSYITRSCATKTPYFGYGLTIALILLAAAVFTVATVFTLGIGPVVAAAVAAGVKAITVGCIGYGVVTGLSLAATGIGTYSFYSKPKPAISTGGKELLSLADSMTKSYPK